MQEMSLSPDAGFVVEWQLADESPVIDLSMAESEVILSDEVAADLRLRSDG